MREGGGGRKRRMDADGRKGLGWEWRNMKDTRYDKMIL